VSALALHCDNPARRTICPCVPSDSAPPRAGGNPSYGVSIIIAIVVGSGCAGGLAYLTRLRTWSRLGPRSRNSLLWLITAIVSFRAGGRGRSYLYRGYALERLQMIGLGRFWSGGVFHTGNFFHLAIGQAAQHNILIAFARSSRLSPDRILSGRRDLVANMIGHGLVDFIANVLPKCFPKARYVHFQSTGLRTPDS